MENLDEMKKFLNTYDLQKLNQQDTENVNRSIASNEIDIIIKRLPTMKSQEPNGFNLKFYPILKENYHQRTSNYSIR
jgi:hypothetical protein